MDLAQQTIILVFLLFPGVVFTRSFLIQVGNVSTEHIFSVSVVYIILSSVLLHYFSYHLLSFNDWYRDAFILFLEFLSEHKDNKEKYSPHIEVITSYFIIVSFFALVSGLIIKHLRLKFLLHSITTKNKTLYQFLKYDSDWFNLLSGFSDKEPKIYYPETITDDEERKNFKVRNRLVEITIHTTFNTVENGVVVDYSLDRNGNLKSIIIDTHDELDLSVRALFKYSDIQTLFIEVIDVDGEINQVTGLKTNL